MSCPHECATPSLSGQELFLTTVWRWMRARSCDFACGFCVQPPAPPPAPPAAPAGPCRDHVGAETCADSLAQGLSCALHFCPSCEYTGYCDATCEAESCLEECQTTYTHEGQGLSCANAGLLAGAAFGHSEGRCSMLVAQGQCTTCSTCDSTPRDSIEADAPCINGLWPAVQGAASSCMSADMTEFTCKADGCPAVMTEVNALYEGTCSAVDLAQYAPPQCADPGTVCASATALPCPAGCATEMPDSCTNDDAFAAQLFGDETITCEIVASSGDSCGVLAGAGYPDVAVGRVPLARAMARPPARWEPVASRRTARKAAITRRLRWMSSCTARCAALRFTATCSRA